MSVLISCDITLTCFYSNVHCSLRQKPFLASPTKLNIRIRAVLKLDLQTQHVSAFSRKLKQKLKGMGERKTRLEKKTALFMYTLKTMSFLKLN